jgi:hypothetical protein
MKRLNCQECAGIGYHKKPILEDGSGPRETCGFCNGTGEVTPKMRGEWLMMKKEEKDKKEFHKEFHAALTGV